ncbi:uncharacterized protein LOC128678780 [Plodia interpunctella]|uniref:uncharacterized protein LOC128678780 n=1 Tax=Plodia interpunctella TaxID=58824 RepID=UPI002368CC68|nr:uncharacterized protein LOC128678780 [Plodia interpunctella]
MTGITFEGETDCLTPRRQELVKEVLQKKNIKSSKVRVNTLGKAGDNYVADVKKITAELENGEAFNMIAKIATNNEITRTLMGTVMLFENECIIYNEVFPKFVDLQTTAGLSEDQFFRFPECYGTLMEPFNEIILLEDLKDSNFEMLDRFTPLTNENVKLILKNFAIYHSLSFVLKKQDPDTFDSFNDKLKDFYSWVGNDPQSQYYFESLETDTLAILDSDNYKKAIRGSVSLLPEHSAKVIKNEPNSRYSIITHGDGWTNNIMFSFKDNVPVQAILIDYQLSKVGNPVDDLQYMIFSSTDHSTRKKHYYEWIDYYHSELDNSLANFGLKANYVYPRDKLDADLRRYSKIYLAMSVLLNTMLIRKSEDAAAMKEKMENGMENPEDIKELTVAVQVSLLDNETVALFKRKIEDLVDSYREFGYID